MTAAPGPHRRIVASLAGGVTDILDLTTRCSLSAVQLARWVQRPRNAEILTLLERLHEARCSLLVAAARSSAAASMLEMTRGHAAGDAGRRACIDLLKLQRDRAPSSREPDADAPGGSMEQAVQTLNRVMASVSSHSQNDKREQTTSAQSGDNDHDTPEDDNPARHESDDQPQAQSHPRASADPDAHAAG